MFGLALLTAGSCPVSWLPIADLIFLATLCNLNNRNVDKDLV